MTGATSAFSVAAQGAGIVAAGSAFDPYASSDSFLLGAFLVENTIAAAYRKLLARAEDAATVDIVSAQLADAIYHGGLITRAIGQVLKALYLSSTGVGGFLPAGANGISG